MLRVRRSTGIGTAIWVHLSTSWKSEVRSEKVNHRSPAQQRQESIGDGVGELGGVHVHVVRLDGNVRTQTLPEFRQKTRVGGRIPKDPAWHRGNREPGGRHHD